jgi:hypothetical protein
MLVSFRGARGRASCYGDVTLDDGNGNIAEFKIKEPAYLTEAGSFFLHDHRRELEEKLHAAYGRSQNIARGRSPARP